MIRKLLIGVGGAMISAAIMATPVPAQTAGAEVRTWTGQVYQLTDPSLEVHYTIEVRKDNGAAPAEGAATTGAKTPMLFGSAAAMGEFLNNQAEPLQGHRRSETITLHKGGTEIRVVLTRIGALQFARQPARSTLPSYAVPAQYRYSAVAVLDDGSRIESDYVNLGTTFLRGSTAQGRIDIPWQQIEAVRFTR